MRKLGKLSQHPIPVSMSSFDTLATRLQRSVLSGETSPICRTLTSLSCEAAAVHPKLKLTHPFITRHYVDGGSGD